MEHSIKQINKDINKLSSLQKLLPSKRCENVDRSNCLFIINLRYLYVQHTELENNCAAPLQKFYRMKFGNFHSIRLFFRSLGTIEKKRLELERDFQRVLEIWNKPINMQQ